MDVWDDCEDMDEMIIFVFGRCLGLMDSKPRYEAWDVTKLTWLSSFIILN